MSQATLPDYRSDDLELERLPRPQLERLQSERLVAMVAYVYERSPFWREKLEDAGVAPKDVRGVEDLGLLPFCTRAELNAEQAEHPPFGRYVCSDRETWAGLFTTSGTSGRKLKRILSRRDWMFAARRFRRNPPAQPGELDMILGPTDGLLGPAMLVEGIRQIGAVPVLAGGWDTQTKVRAIAELRPAVVTGVASYMMHLAEVAEELGVDLSQCGIRNLHSIGEPGASVEATRTALLERFGAEHIIDGYGLSEVGGLGMNCHESTALHLPEDSVVVECVDPQTGKPVADGESGELVFTNIVSDTQPVLRYRSSDIGRLIRGPACACGRTVTRVARIEGRADDMIWYRGVNFFPSAVEQIVRRQEGLSPEYRIVLDQPQGALPRLTIQVEALGDPADEALGAALRNELKGGLGISADVELLARGALPRDEQGKARRILDRRETVTTG